jgi:hypothetical protein
MNLNDMLEIVRKDLHDVDQASYRWTDEALARHIAHSVRDFSAAIPREIRVVLPTVGGSREIDVALLAERTAVEAVEYPLGLFPARYPRFSLWGDTIALLEGDTPDGSDCNIYYGKLHTLDGLGSTIPLLYEDLVAAGACGYAAAEMAINSINRVNTGGTGTPEDWAGWGKEKLTHFRTELKRLAHNNRVRCNQLYTP